MKKLITASVLVSLPAAAFAHVSHEQHVHTELGRLSELLVNFAYSPWGVISLVIAGLAITAIIRRKQKN